MSLADLFRNPKEALEYFEYVLTQPNTYERHFSGHKVVFNYAAPNSVFSCWEHYGSNGKVIKTSDDEAKLECTCVNFTMNKAMACSCRDV